MWSYGGDYLDFDVNGMLPAGIHTYDIHTFKEQFVNGFPNSQTRPAIFSCLEHYISTILNLENIKNLLMIDNDFKKYIDLIIEDLSKKSNDTSKNHLESS